ncbi:MAG TPA: fused MFS/spermidine synthase [Gemmatimonadaceae bacterium]
MNPFAAAIFVNAFLLFLLQPMFAKMALPHLGGSAAVWTSCMLFFQTALLAGYLYAHWLGSRANARWQVMLHLGAVAAAALCLPPRIPVDWAPADVASPVPDFLWLLARRIGPPFVLLAAGSPLLQHWFARARIRGDRDPYSLYVASNFGSAVALFAYPFFLERQTSLAQQTLIWSSAYAALFILLAVCGAFAWNAPAMRPEAGTQPSRHPPVSGRPAESPIQWVILAAVPSSMMLGVTSHITIDLAPMPLLWILPLALYLTTFVIAFGTPSERQTELVRLAVPYVVIVLAALLFLRSEFPGKVGYTPHLAAFFICALACHLRLAELRPHESRLTEFYLWLAVGGAVGGAFNVLVAPALFNTVVEYPIAIVLVAVIYRPRDGAPSYRDFAVPAALGVALAVFFMLDPDASRFALGVATLVGGITAFALRKAPMRFALAIAAMIFVGSLAARTDGTERLAARSFYGVYRVVDDSAARIRDFYSGTTIHGAELFGDSGRSPASYYHRDGPLGGLFAARAWRPAPWRVGVVGLGVGSTAAYARPNETWTFYEIDPLVAKIAADDRLFHFLHAAVVTPRIVLGDARLSLAAAPKRSLDVLLVDAFSSDAIPTHLLTREALSLYRQRLAEDGIIAWHISNRYLDLRPVLQGLAADAGMTALIMSDQRIPKESGGRFPSVWVAMSAGPQTVASLRSDARWQPLRSPRPPIVWTDERSDVLSVLR